MYATLLSICIDPTLQSAMTDAHEETTLESDPNSMGQVHAAWLAAGAEGNVEVMQCLRARHPQWLDLNRVCALCSFFFCFCSRAALWLSLFT